MGKTGKIFLTICAAAAAVALFVYGAKNFNMNVGGPPSHLDKMLDKLQSLPADYSLNQARKDGLVNVAGIQKERNEIIDRFFQQTDSGDLVTAESVEDDVLIRFYYYDADLGLIRSWKYYVGEQAVKEADKRFSKEYREETEGGVTTVFLTGAESASQSEDEVLYQYYEK